MCLIDVEKFHWPKIRRALDWSIRNSTILYFYRRLCNQFRNFLSNFITTVYFKVLKRYNFSDSEMQFLKLFGTSVPGSIGGYESNERPHFVGESSFFFAYVPHSENSPFFTSLSALWLRVSRPFSSPQRFRIFDHKLPKDPNGKFSTITGFLSLSKICQARNWNLIIILFEHAQDFEENEKFSFKIWAFYFSFFTPEFPFSSRN